MHRTTGGSFEVGLFPLDATTVTCLDPYPHRRALGIAGGQVGGRHHRDLTQQILHVVSTNACRLELLRPDLAVQQGDCGEMFQVVIGLLFSLRMVFVAVASAAGDVVGGVEHLEHDACDIVCTKPIFIAQSQRRLDDGLSVDACTVLLQIRLFHAGQRTVVGAETNRLVEQL